MSMYFENQKTSTLSGYVDWLRQMGDYTKEQKIKDTRFIREILGDVRLPGKVINELISQLHISGGKYDTSIDEKINGLYEIYCKFPNLTAKAIREISSRYIKDLFEEFSLTSVLESMIKESGETDEVFKKFIETVDTASEEQQKRFIEEATKLDEYMDEYSNIGCSLDYISYLKTLVIREHIPVDRIIRSMPERKLIEKDAKHLTNLSRQTRIYTGVCLPATYELTRTLAKNGDLKSTSDQPTYYASIGNRETPTTFTKQDFINSVLAHRQKILSK